MVVRTHELVTRMTDQDRPCYQFKKFTASVAAEATFPDVGDRVTAMHFDERRIRRPGIAPVVAQGDRFVFKNSRRRHYRLILAVPARHSNPRTCARYGNILQVYLLHVRYDKTAQSCHED